MTDKVKNKAYIIFTLVFAGLCAVIVGIFALIFLVLAPNVDNTLIFILAILLSIVAIFIFIVLIAMIRTSLQDGSSKIFPVSQIALTVLTVVVSIFWAILPHKVIGTTFEPGDFSATEKCYMSDDPVWPCTELANGGRVIFRTGMSKNDIEIQYYCAEHFAQIKEIINNNDKNEINESDVWYEAKEIVKNRLKAPSTASFCSKSSATITKSGKTWVIEGYVDAENSFGAMIRNDFRVVLLFQDDTHYTISKCTITPR